MLQFYLKIIQCCYEFATWPKIEIFIQLMEFFSNCRSKAVTYHFRLWRYTKIVLIASDCGVISNEFRNWKELEENTHGGFILVQIRYSEELACNFPNRRFLEHGHFPVSFFPENQQKQSPEAFCIKRCS